MPDRVIRDELLQSDRWLDLPTDTHRLVYSMLILLADDYGNAKGGPRRLFRWMQAFSQVKTEPDSTKLLSDLQDADLVGRYEAEGVEYWHVHRFKNSRWYWKRAWPKSPFSDDVDNESKQRRSEKRHTHVGNTLAIIGDAAKNSGLDIAEKSNILNKQAVEKIRREGVGVGVGEKLSLAFGSFWSLWPAHFRKQARGKCAEVWKRKHLDAKAPEILAHVGGLKNSEQWRDPQYVPSPLVYLNGERWDGAETPQPAKAKVSW